MSKKSILTLVFILSFSFSSLAQETVTSKNTFPRKLYAIYFSEFMNIPELRGYKRQFPKSCAEELNAVETKICDALKQFIKEKEIKFLFNGDEIKRILEEPTIVCGPSEEFTDVTTEFIEYYNTHFAKKKKNRKIL